MIFIKFIDFKFMKIYIIYLHFQHNSNLHIQKLLSHSFGAFFYTLYILKWTYVCFPYYLFVQIRLPTPILHFHNSQRPSLFL